MTPIHPGGHSDRIGHYRLLEPIGEGGMAEVYLAEQSEPVRRRVALKVLKAGMDSKQVVARFESERQALAVLDHPNIAKVFDGGIAGNGRPYFVMEYVDGVPITDFCDAGRLTIDARLRLFTDVCRAVQHAHLKGLIHRDLKPSNILVGHVDGAPQPKVIDFGVAKATESPLTDSTLETRIGQAIGTPQFMSPEQTGLGGVDVDTRADVYSLGVVLYELLVGALPLDLGAVRDIALPGVIREKIPPVPSARFAGLGADRSSIADARRLRAQELDRSLRGDLDWIVMKAIDKDRDRRYETANALAQDCRRHLDHDTVLARPPSPGYRLARFVRRNRGPVAAAAVAVVALVCGALVATFGYLRATAAEQVAVREAETARQVSEFLVGLFETSDPAESRGSEVTARQVLDRGVESIASELQGQPLVRAKFQNTLGSVYRNLGLYAEAEPLFRQSFDMRRQLLGPDHPDTLITANWLATAITEQGRLREATPINEETLERRRRVLGDRHRDTLVSIQNLAVNYRFSGRPLDAEPLFLEALAGEREVLGNDDELTLLTMSNLGALYTELGRYDEARPLLERAAEIHGRVYGADHPQTLLAFTNLGDLYYGMGRYDDAEELYTAALEGRRRVLGTGNSQTYWSMDRLASLYTVQGRYAEAEPLQREAADGLAGIYGDQHPDTLSGKVNLAEVYRAQDRFDEAEPLYREVLAVQRRDFPADIDTGITMHNLAALLNSTGRPEEALDLFAGAENIWKDIVAPDHLYRMENARLWAEARRATGDEDGAAELEARIEELDVTN